MFTRSNYLIFGQSGCASNANEKTSDTRAVRISIPMIAENAAIYDFRPDELQAAAKTWILDSPFDWVSLDSLEFVGVKQGRELRKLIVYALPNDTCSESAAQEFFLKIKDTFFELFTKSLKFKSRLEQSVPAKPKVSFGQLWIDQSNFQL